MMVKTFPYAALAVALIVSLGGCHPYVNIPPQKGDVAAHSANRKNVRAVSIKAIEAVHDDRPVDGPYTVMLAAGSNWESYQKAVEALGENATMASSPDIPIIETREIRIRAADAQVDVVRPAAAALPRGPGQRITVYLTWDPIGGWMVKRMYKWQSTVEVAEPPVISPPTDLKDAAEDAEPNEDTADEGEESAG